MRVIAGDLRSRPLIAPRGLDVRPTSDRLRETLFNVLAPRIAGSRFADLYAGSGAVGIEAISRGASFVHFAEKSAAALRALRANLTSLNITASYSLEDRGTAPLLASLAKRNLPLDLVFLDPPYTAANEYAATLETLARSITDGHSPLLAPNALIIAEHSRKSPLPDRIGPLQTTRILPQGDASLTFYAAVTS